jgi:predicted DNA-binding transcriptional regulator AlpA
MTTDSKDFTTIKAAIDSRKVGDIVIDALQEILPHVRAASTADIMMAYAVMTKSTLIGMDLSEAEKDKAKVLFDQMWPEVLIDQVVATHISSTSIRRSLLLEWLKTQAVKGLIYLTPSNDCRIMEKYPTYNVSSKTIKNMTPIRLRPISQSTLVSLSTLYRLHTIHVQVPLPFAIGAEQIRQPAFFNAHPHFLNM